MDMKEIEKLMVEIEETKKSLELAHKEYDVADSDMLDSVAYKIKSLTCRYEALSRRLKNHVFPKVTQKQVVKPTQKILIFLGIR